MLIISLIFAPILIAAAVEIKQLAAVFNSQTVGLYPQQTLTGNGSLGGADNTIVSGVGGLALLPDTGVIGTMVDIGDRPTGDQISVYQVRDGDSLSQIAEMFGVSVNTIIWANDLPTNALIKEGQTLVILPISGLRYTVRKGDTLASIAKDHNGDVKEILQFNGLAADVALAAGAEIIIPNGEAVPVEKPRSARRLAEERPSSGGGNNKPVDGGYYLKPLASSVKTQGLHGYNGVDLAAPSGTPILASAAGSVMISKTGGWNGGYGNYVVIRHGNGTQTLYAHNLENIVAVGQSLVQGQVIGYVGSTGQSTGSHVHFEVRGAKNPF